MEALRKKSKSVLFILLILTLPASVLAGCSGKAETGSEAGMAMADLHTMPAALPAEVQAAPVTVREAYQFAVANPEITEQFPCYCGCGKMGHTSNYSCYVQEVDPAGQVSYDMHALGCSICVDITQDVMRLLRDQQTIPEIQTYIDHTYAKYGPSNFPVTFEPAGPAPQSIAAESGSVPVCAAAGGQPSC